MVEQECQSGHLAPNPWLQGGCTKTDGEESGLLDDEEKHQVGDIVTDHDGSEWVILEAYPRRQDSRVRRNSLAHQVLARNSAVIRKSLTEEPDGG